MNTSELTIAPMSRRSLLSAAGAAAAAGSGLLTFENLTVGVPFRYTIAASNDPDIFGATALPPGLSFDTATGVVAGLPTATGTYAVTIAATNAAGSGTATLTLTVK